MAHSTLAALAHPDFHNSFDRFFSGIELIVVRAEARAAKAHLSECAFSNEYVSCAEVATVHHLASEQEFCARHFQAVSRG